MKQATKPKLKWDFAIGTTSRVPGRPRHHYLIADFDVEFPRITPLIKIAGNMFWQRTKSGWHVYTDSVYTFGKLCEILSIIGADPAWIRIGRKRGYFFLADKSAVYLPWPVERMQLHYNGKKKIDA